jgi:hypothetical protein
MRLIPSDPDVATIVARIKNGDIDLQPDFQRGEVWGDGKKRRLIDSILRDWHVPPIHVIALEDSAVQEVLDGQQRLVAIRDFVEGRIRVDGNAEPYDPDIAALDGYLYDDLPLPWRRRFDQFTIRVFRITDYSAEEPSELFYRLNQPTGLTAAEQRNAFFGPVRKQVKRLVAKLEENGITKDFIGFSNSRMAYDDVLARLCYSIQEGTLEKKVTAGTLANWYRSAVPYDENTIEHCERAIDLLGAMRRHIASPVKLNKATAYSWMWFIACASIPPTRDRISHILADFLRYFEDVRASVEKGGRLDAEYRLGERWLPQKFVSQLMMLYRNRASARVADISSVVTRDFVIWLVFLTFLDKNAIRGNARWQDRRRKIDVALMTLEQEDRDGASSANQLVDFVLDSHAWGWFE